MAKPFGQVGRGLPGLTSVCDRCRRLVGHLPTAQPFTEHRSSQPICSVKLKHTLRDVQPMTLTSPVMNTRHVEHRNSGAVPDPSGRG